MYYAVLIDNIYYNYGAFGRNKNNHSEWKYRPVFLYENYHLKLCSLERDVTAKICVHEVDCIFALRIDSRESQINHDSNSRRSTKNQITGYLDPDLRFPNLE